MNFFQFLCHFTELNGTLHTGNKPVLADIITEGINCPEYTELHETSACLVSDEQALDGCSGQARQRSALTFGDLSNTYVSTVLKAGYRYERIDIVFDRYREETIKATNKKNSALNPLGLKDDLLRDARDLPLSQNVRIQSINQVFVYLRKTPSDTDAGGVYNRIKK